MVTKIQPRVTAGLITFGEVARYGHLLLCRQNCLGFDEESPIVLVKLYRDK
jgi:hypothetical protein